MRNRNLIATRHRIHGSDIVQQSTVHAANVAFSQINEKYF